ncbi:MAG: response regulator transcription factor [Spongiibacteraceae bacterium]
MAIRVILVDDHYLLREALREKLEKEVDIEIVGEAGDGHSALHLIAELKPDVVVLDISLCEMSGVDIAAQIKANHSTIKVLALSMHSDKRFVMEMLKAGASGYVTKTAASTELLSAIRAVAVGKHYVGAEVANALVDGVQNGTDSQTQLGRREREVLRLLAEGLRTQDIADRLYISSGTVEVHRRNIMRKLDLHTIAELTKYAIREGITSL